MRKQLFALILGLTLFLPAPEARADNLGLIFRGIGKVVAGAFQIPGSMLKDSGRVPFPFGLVTGAIGGSIKTVGWALSGTYDMARGAAPYAKYLIFLA